MLDVERKASLMSSRVKTIFFVLFIQMLVAAPGAFAQNGALTGTVIIRYKNDLNDNDYVKEKGKVKQIPARNLQVIIYVEGTSDFPMVLTDKYGKFAFPRLPQGYWSFSVSPYDKPDNYADPHPPQIPINENKNTDVDIILVRTVADGRVRPDSTPVIVRAMYSDTISNPEYPKEAHRERVSQDKEKQVQTRELTGKVVNAQQRPLDRVQIVAYAIDTDVQRAIILGRAETGADGAYKLTISSVKDYKSYILRFYKDGYLTNTLFSAWSQNPASVISLKDSTVIIKSAISERPSVEMARRYVFEPRVMQALPLPGTRNFDRFALLAPGVLPPPETSNTNGPGLSPGVGTAGQFAVNGLRSRENNFTMDGSDNNDEDIGTRRQGFVALTPQPIESLQEFQIITLLADARYGRNIGGQVDALTRSGSKDLHGSMYGFLTNNRLNARDFFDQTTRGGPASYSLTRVSDNAAVQLDGRPLTVPNPVGGTNPFTRGQIGFVAGGRIKPINTFFFGSLERQIVHASKETNFSVPTVKQRGVFETGDTGLKANGTPSFPSSVPGNAFFSLFPFPNNPIGPYGQNTYTAVLPADADATRFSVKLGKYFGDSSSTRKRPLRGILPVPMHGDLLTGRYNFTQDKSILPTVGNALFSSLDARVRTQNLAFFLNRSLAHNIFDTIRFSYGRTRLSFNEVLNPGQLSSAALPGVPFLLNRPLLLNVTAPNTNGTLNPPSFVTASSPQGVNILNTLGYPPVTQTEQITGPLGQVWIPGFSPIGVDVLNFPQARVNNTFQMADTVTYVHGNHTWNFGADIRKTHINSRLDRNFRPLVQFDSLRASSAALPLTQFNGTALPQDLLTGATLAAAGVPTGFFQTLARVPDSTIGIRFSQINLFVQDEWRARPRLRLTYGFRYELNTIPKTAGGRLEKAFDPVKLQSDAKAAALACQPHRCDDLVAALTSAFPADYKVSFGADRSGFDGRLGLAYQLDKSGRTVFRTGFGSFTGLYPGIVLSQSRNAFSDFLPLNLANFSLRAGNTSYLFNLANPNVRPLGPAGVRPLDVIRPGTINTITDFNPIVLLTSQLFNLGSLSLSPTVLGLDLALPQKRLKAPYAFEYGATFEHQFYEKFYWSASYVWTRGVKLLRVNTPDLGLNRNRIDFTDVKTLDPGFVFPFFLGSIRSAQPPISSSFTIARTLFESSSTSKYHSFQFEFRKRYIQHFQAASSVTYSHAIDDASDFFDTAGAYALPQDSLQRSETAASNFNARWRWTSYFLLDIPRDLPFGKSRLGGWQVAGVLTFQSGQPFTVNSAFDVNRDGNLTDRLNDSSRLSKGPGGSSPVQLNLAPGIKLVDLLAADGLDGRVGRNTFTSQGIQDVDLSVTKNINLSSKTRILLRAETFNLFNHSHFNIPVRILESPGFGRSTATTIPARTIQFAAKLMF
jgi:hypothetical protein